MRTGCGWGEGERVEAVRLPENIVNRVICQIQLSGMAFYMPKNKQYKTNNKAAKKSVT